MMKFNIITLFPDFFSSFLQSSLTEKAIAKGILSVNIIDLRKFSTNKHGRVDEKIFGGGAGMLLQIEPIDLALKYLQEKEQNPNNPKTSYTILTDARGKQLNTNWARKMATEQNEITLICGNYEGVDYRVHEYLIDEAISIGDYITAGGESVALVIMEVISRFIDGFMSKSSSYEEESHDETGLLEYPQYTRPEDYKGWKVPEVLLSGHHKNVDDWRKEKRVELSKKYRPDLLKP